MTRPIDPIGRIETAFKDVLATETVVNKIKLAQKEKLPKGDFAKVSEEVLNKKIITEKELSIIIDVQNIRLVAITVDDFKNNEL